MAEEFSLKEMIQELRTDNKQFFAQQAAILSTLEGIQDHLGTLNSKVATHEKRLGDLDVSSAVTTTKVTTVASLISVVLTTIITQFIRNT